MRLGEEAGGRCGVRGGEGYGRMKWYRMRKGQIGGKGQGRRGVVRKDIRGGDKKAGEEGMRRGGKGDREG